MAQLSLWLLGSFRVTLDGESVTDFATDNARALLAYLSVEADRAHRRDFLAGLLWPRHSREKALRSLRQALYHLRQAIDDQDAAAPSETAGKGGGHFLLAKRHTIQFNPQSDHWLDVAAFTSLAGACRRHRHRDRGTCLPCLRSTGRMVALYRGEFLEQFPAAGSHLFEEWVLLQREWLHREAIEALIQLANYHERRGQMRQARTYAQRQVELEPWREEAHRQLMRLWALDGQRSAALAQYKACRQALATELSIEPTEETAALYESIRADQAAPLLRRPSAPTRSLPPSPTPFVGRDQELAELAELLANPDCRLVTLVGPGGIGKTRLALQAATDQIGNFLHGVAFVPLAPVSSPDLLVSAIADALGFSFRERADPEGQLLNYLREKELLLVLDGMEHILEGAELLARILHRALGVIMLVSSRQRLNLREEWVRVVEGLSYPRHREDGSERAGVTVGESLQERVELAEVYSAIKLFRQQARRVHHRFSLSTGETPHVVRICQLVEGLPLGVELAAAWTGVRSSREIAEEIERNLDVLSTAIRNVPERQRSIRATFEHSWQLLSPGEQDLLARLSVFRGGFDREAALRVTGASLPTLLALMDKSLVRRVAPDRYDMHGLLAQYAADKLGDSPEQPEWTEMQHARYFAALLERQTDQLRTAKGKEDFHVLALELENTRQAWQVMVARDCPDLIERGLESLYLFYDVQGRYQEGINLFDRAIEPWAGDPEQVPVLEKVISRQGALHLRLGRYQEARAALEEGLAISRRLDARGEQVFCLVNLANLAHKQGRHRESESLSQRSLELSRQTGDSWGRIQSLFSLGLVRYRAGDIEPAEAFLEESVAVARETGNPRLMIAPLNGLGDVACHRGDYDRGLALFQECLALSRELGHDFRAALILNNLGTVFHVLRNVREARSAYQESLEICRQIGDRGGQAIALSNLGEVAYAAGDYAEAERLYQQGLAIGRDIRDQWTVMACLNNLGELAYALQDNDGAKRHFAEALAVGWDTQTLPSVVKVLVNLAPLFAQEGETDHAATLLSLARQHPASEQAIQKKAERLLHEMGIAAPADVAETLDAVVAGVLARISS
jgi:predicted ATPase/DNA-binding SARP family transcriptional activator